MDRNKLTIRQFIRLLPVALLAFVGRLFGQSSGSFASAYKPYDVISTFIGVPPNSQTICLVTLARTLNFPANFANSVGSCGTNPTATATLTVYKNGVSVGTVSISTSGVFSFSTSGAIQFNAGDILSVVTQPSADATLANISVSLAGLRQGV